MNPQAKLEFLKITYRILSDPDSSQDQRDAGLELLSVVDLTDVDEKKLRNDYIHSVYYLKDDLTENSDPYGETDALF